jgi:hypothetical protein
MSRLVYDFAPHTLGDTIEQFRLRALSSDTAVSVTSAILAVSASDGSEVHTWDESNTSFDEEGWVNFDHVESTEAWPLGDHYYTLKVTFDTGVTKALMHGMFPVVP